MALTSRLLPSILLFTTLTPVLHADVKSGMDAIARKDYNTAWRELMPLAMQGNSEAEALVGTMLFQKINPPGTGFYADCEKWLVASARQNNPHAMTELGKFYYDDAMRLNGGINPGHNDYVAPGRQQQAEQRLRQSRDMYERAAALGDGYAMASLAILLDSGIGGPKDPPRAAQLRAGVYKATGGDAGFTKKATADPGLLAMTAAWQQGKYAQALADARIRAQKGEPAAQALLGRAYYLGVGVQKNYQQARYWLDQAVSRNNADAMYFLGLMYEHGSGVPQNLDRAVELFDRATKLGQRYADMEVQGMRLQGESDRVAAMAHRGRDSGQIACETAGGISTPGACIKGGEHIDPFMPTPEPTYEQPSYEAPE